MKPLFENIRILFRGRKYETNILHNMKTEEFIEYFIKKVGCDEPAENFCIVMVDKLLVSGATTQIVEKDLFKDFKELPEG